MSKKNRNRYNKLEQPKMVSSSTLVDIVVAVHNRFDIFEKCLDSIPASADGISYRIIVVDNNSYQAEASEFYAKREDISLIKNKENVGFPKACNQGVRRGNSPLLFFLNSDVILEPGSLKSAVKQLDDPKIGVCGMLLKFPEYAEGLNQDIRPAGKVQHVGLETNIHGRWIHALIGWSVDHPKVVSKRDVYAVTVLRCLLEGYYGIRLVVSLKDVA